MTDFTLQPPQLNESELAIARGIKRGLAEFQLENQARNATKEQLTIEQLSGG